LLLVRKLATARQPEFAIGAVAMVGDHLTTIANPSLRTMRSPSSTEFDRALRRESAVLRQRAADYRRFRSARPLAGRSLVLVDDGMATGVTMRAAVAATPGTAVVAVPVASAEACRSLLEAGATVVCPWPRDDFGAVSMYYERFEQLSDQDVHRLLQQ
ncbi:MAG TPA: hypothetical protein VHO01_11700, partial [Jatrophihabitans sp.]|nr:hypothetical protein [Jatrophihabitans sp.]